MLIPVPRGDAERVPLFPIELLLPNLAVAFAAYNMVDARCCFTEDWASGAGIETLGGASERCAYCRQTG